MTPGKYEFAEQQELQQAMASRREYMNDMTGDYQILDEDIDDLDSDMQEDYPEVDEDTTAETDVADTYFEIIEEDTEEPLDHRNTKYVTGR